MALPANVGTFNVSDHMQRGLTGAFPTWTIDVTFGGLSDDATATTPTTLVPETQTFTAVSGLMTMNGLPVPLDPDLSPSVVLHIKETIDGVVNNWDWQPDTSLAGTTVRLAAYRVIGAQQLLTQVKGAQAISYQQAQSLIANAIAGVGTGGTAILDSNSLIKSSLIQTAAIGLNIPGVLAQGQTVAQSVAYSRPIRFVQVETDIPSLAGNIVITITWEERATGVLHTTTATLTALTELSDTIAVTWNVVAGDVIYATITSTGSVYGGANLRVTLLGQDASWPAELSAPGALATATISSGTLTTAAGSGITPNVLVTYGTGGSETILGQGIYPVATSVDVSAAGTQPVNVYPANRDNIGPVTTIGSYTYFYQPSGSSLDTTKMTLTSTSGTETVSGGYLNDTTGSAGSFAVADKIFHRLQSAASTDLSLANLNWTEEVIFTTTGELDFYYRNTQQDDVFAAGQNAYQVQIRPSGSNWNFNKHVGVATTNLATGTLPSITLGTSYTIRIQASGTSHSAKIWQTSLGEGTATVLYSATTDGAITAAGKLVIVEIGPSSAGTPRQYKIGTSAVA